MARRSKEEINQTAKKLAQRSQLFRDSLQVFPRAEHDSLETAEELTKQCRELEDRLHHLQEEKASIASGNVDDVKYLLAKLEVWKQQKIEGTATTSGLLVQLQHVVQQQQTLLAITRGTRISLDQKLRREEKLLDEKYKMRTGLEEKLTNKQETTHAGVEVEGKIRTMTCHCDMLTQKLKHFLHTHISLPDKWPSGKGKQKTLDEIWKKSSTQNLIPPEEIVLALIEKTIESPYDPYLECNENLYPPFVQLLLVLGIIQRHPNNPALIRMTPYHYQ
ncbi:centromere protein K-like [Dysidea avara]|uniref:centromere protein K-like n=1 Tax=Dysidea avara TaxID=196820 RepID=UPI0033339423